jgi:hypothetical protein
VESIVAIKSLEFHCIRHAPLQASLNSVQIPRLCAATAFVPKALKAVTSKDVDGLEDLLRNPKALSQALRRNRARFDDSGTPLASGLAT